MRSVLRSKANRRDGLWARRGQPGRPRWSYGIVVLAALMRAGPAPGQAAPVSRPAAGSQPAAASAPAGGRVIRTRAQVEALIEQAGKSRPDWWDEVELKYPPTLDLTWSNEQDQSLGWAPNRKLGAYIWGVIGANPDRFQEGVKLLHHCLSVNKDNPAALARTMNALGAAYYDLLEDYPRAVFWWRMGAKILGREPTNYMALARSYFRMGNTQMAAEILNRFPRDTTGQSVVVRVWQEMGATERALAMAQAQVQAGLPDAGYLVMGDIHRQAGQFQQALACYQKVVAATKGSLALEKNKKRARINIDNIQVLEALDLTRIPDGAYAGSALGYIDDVEVAVAVKRGRIESIQVTKTREDRPLVALREMPARIIAKQAIQGVDVVSGATVTSDAIIYATGKALQKGMVAADAAPLSGAAGASR